MTFEEYEKVDRINWSTLKELRRSPKHYLYRLEHPRGDTTAMAKGRATHTAIFEPDRFLLDYALFDGDRRSGKEWNACCAANKGKTILKREEYEICLAMRDAVRSHPVASKLLLQGKPEQVVTWTDDFTGLQCKARLDWLLPDFTICDLKTTTDIDAGRFGALAARMGYHCQLAFYAGGIQASAGVIPKTKIIAVEAAAPHDIAVFGLDDDALYAGEQECKELISKISACRFSAKWPGRYEDEQSLMLPGWVFTKTDDVAGLDLTVNGQEA